MKQNFDILLHKATKHSNRMIPFSLNVSNDKYPAQNNNIVGTTRVLKYRDRFIATSENDEIPDNGRPHDDEKFIPFSSLTKENDIIQQNSFIILRADIEPPYRYIAISTDYSKVITGMMVTMKSSENTYNDIDESIIPVATFQTNDYIGLVVEDMYPGSIYTIDADVIAVDSGEPCNVILMEYVDRNDEKYRFNLINNQQHSVRFVFGDECMSKVVGYYNNSNLAFIPLNNLEDFYIYNPQKSFNDIIRLRKQLFSNIAIVVDQEENNEEDSDS